MSVDGRQTQACRIINEPHKEITAASEARGHDDCLDASAADLTWDESQNVLVPVEFTQGRHGHTPARQRIYASQSHGQKPLEPVPRQDMRSSFQSWENSLTATFAAVGAVTHIIHFIGHNTY
ncbi:hypothetical protein [Methylobacter tundripaludum]|uniref:hypothetical protein n=1 Tax=Methylobacter tundripaludum TaxID=173365 RepID=UPI0005909972|nr:hypothetical protein [Methylobacter tundripaludum]